MGWKTVATEDYVAAALTAYQLESEKDAANGYCGLDGNARLATARLGTGTADATKVLSGTQTWINQPFSKTVYVESPSATTLYLGYFNEQMTITKVVGVFVGGTTPSTTIQISHGASIASLTTDVFSSAQTINSTTLGNVLTTFASSTIGQQSFMDMEITTVTGSPTGLLVTLFFDRG